MNYVESMAAKLAADVVAAFGGHLSFDDYDKYMHHVQYIAPFNWYCQRTQKENNDKLCAFAAVRDGLLIKEDGGYRLP